MQALLQGVAAGLLPFSAPSPACSRESRLPLRRSPGGGGFRSPPRLIHLRDAAAGLLANAPGACAKIGSPWPGRRSAARLAILRRFPGAPSFPFWNGASNRPGAALPPTRGMFMAAAAAFRSLPGRGCRDNTSLPSQGHIKWALLSSWQTEGGVSGWEREEGCRSDAPG